MQSETNLRQSAQFLGTCEGLFRLYTSQQQDTFETKKAKEAVEKLRNLTKGYFQITKEQEDAKKRKRETEKQINKNKSLESELNV